MHAWSFLFTAFLEIALSTQRACVLQMQSQRYLRPLLPKTFIVCDRVFALASRKWSIYYIVVYFTTRIAGVCLTYPI